MKTLYIVRHAKAFKDMENIFDWQRPLTENGVERAVMVSKILKLKNIYPDKMISSHAFRALNTAVIFALTLDYLVDEIEINHYIYQKSAGDLIELLKKQSDKFSSLMIFGHNPGFSDLYCRLTGEKNIELSTSATAGIQFETDNWKKIDVKKGEILFFETGK